MFVQQITPYVDTKDRSAGGNEIRERLALLEQRVLALKRESEGRDAAAVGPPRSGADGAQKIRTVTVTPAAASK